MAESRLLDLRGLCCPEPALRSERALKSMVDMRLEILVDSDTARENVARQVRRAGYQLNIREGSAPGEYQMDVTR